MSTRAVNVRMADLINSLGRTLPGAGVAPGPLDKLLSARLPTALSFRLSGLIDEIDPPVKRYNKQQQALVEELAPEGLEKLSQEQKKEVDARFAEAMETLGNEEVTIRVPVVTPADLDRFELLSPAECRALKWLFVDEG
ncbi:MAG TPA: hypothetical protein VF659_01675 [Pyrinomonadaceae bacterium]|jgi:hypothetical protein